MFKHRYSHMVHNYYVGRIREIMTRRQAEINSLACKKDAEAYVLKIKKAVKNCFSSLPLKKTPLNPEITGREEYKDYYIEKIIFESRPGFKVSGNLYLPRNISERVPGVLGLCGHSDEGKAAVPYQSFSIGLAKRGFMVFIIDPISQGERKQFSEKNSPYLPGLCHGHNIMGNRMILLGDFFGSWRLWDAIRALDYLLMRPEVDKKRIGVTGNSGGGTLTTYVTAIDDRITMAAPSCFICSYLANIENELPSDAEQNPPGILAQGLDQIDLLMCHAPRPTLIMGQYDDFFDIRYTRERFKDLKKIHLLLGSNNSSGLFIGPGVHGYSLENREAMYAWFMKHAGLRGPIKEGEIITETPRKLFVTAHGDIAEKKSLTVYTITSREYALLKKSKKKLSSKSLKNIATRLLGIPILKNPPHYKPLRYSSRDEFAKTHFYKQTEFAVESESGIDVLTATYGLGHGLMHPPAGNIDLFIGHGSSQEDIEKNSEIRKFVSEKRSLAAVDPRGFGQSMAKTCGSKNFFEPYGADYLYAATGEMLNENYFGRRVFDILRVMDFFYSGGAGEIRLIGRGIGSTLAVFAAILHRLKPEVTIINYLPSFEVIINTPVFEWPLSSFPRGILKYFDLPDIYHALGQRLTKKNPWGADMKPIKYQA